MIREFCPPVLSITNVICEIAIESGYSPKLSRFDPSTLSFTLKISSKSLQKFLRYSVDNKRKDRHTNCYEIVTYLIICHNLNSPIANSLEYKKAVLSQR